MIHNSSTKEEKRLQCLSFLLFIPILLDFIKVVTRGNSTSFTYIVYVVSLFYFLFIFRKDISIKFLGLLSLFYFIFACSYLLFPKTRPYYSSEGFILLCVYFLPLVFLVVRKISNWDGFFRIMSWFGIIAVIMGAYIVFLSGVELYSADERYFTYMEFSYAQLPFVCSLYMHSKKKSPWFFFSFFLLGFFEMLVYGSRATVLYVLLFILLIDFAGKLSKIKNLIIGSAIICLLYISYEYIVNWLSGFSSISDSYVLRHIISGDLFSSESRELIYDSCRSRIETMGLDVSGFFGDRDYCGSIYPHNFIFEVLMQWGWVFGSLFLFYLLYLIVKAFQNKPNYAILVFIICCLLGRYFVSGTYVTEGKFWIFYGCLLALTNKNSFSHE